MVNFQARKNFAFACLGDAEFGYSVGVRQKIAVDRSAGVMDTWICVVEISTLKYIRCNIIASSFSIFRGVAWCKSLSAILKTMRRPT